MLSTLTACGVPLGGHNASRLQGIVLDQELNEMSGLTASPSHKNTFWVLNDGGNSAKIYAIDQFGSRIATYTVDGINNTDWEDIDHYSVNGRHFLVIADTGDNGALRKTLQLHVLEEPHQLANDRIAPIRSIAFKFPDGPHDTEAIAVDPVNRQVLVITKKRQPPLVYAVSLDPDAPKVQTAKRLGEVLGIPAASAQELKDRPRTAQYDHQVTAASIAPDGTRIAVMTYRNLLIYPRTRNQTWAQALAGSPQIRLLPVIPQAEAMGFSADGQSVFATGEFNVAPLYRIPLSKGPAP